MPTNSLSYTLERDLIQHRLRRIELVTRALRDRAVYRHAGTGATPPPLREALSSFERELAALRVRLTDLRKREQLPSR